MAGTKSIGGTDGMHFPGNGPFGSARGMKGSSKHASSQAAHPTAAGSVGKNQSASANMKTKRALNGSGKA